MGFADYQFVSEWWVEASVQEVSDILGDAKALPRWWPAVYLEVAVLESGGSDGVGQRVEVHTKGWLPYALRWQFRTTESRKPYGFSLEASGDFIGRGIWTFEQYGDRTKVVYDWRIRARKPLIRYLSFLLKPIFSANHRWAMAKGEQSLRLELLRRRANSPEELARVPRPPQPTFLVGSAR